MIFKKLFQSVCRHRKTKDELVWIKPKIHHKSTHHYIGNLRYDVIAHHKCIFCGKVLYEYKYKKNLNENQLRQLHLI